KAAGPDCVSSYTHCADQLFSILADLFNPEQSTVPACFKSSAIIPIPRKQKISSLNDYRPVPLTSVVMKCLERLILHHLKSATNDLQDPCSLQS
ncbi:hypothetical protein LDENG_00232250, partial [Lucifuga dentata]